MAHYQSIIFSVDTLATLVIYFVPKFLAKDANAVSTRFGIGSEHRRVSGMNSIASEPSIPLFRQGDAGSFRDENSSRDSKGVSFLEPNGLRGTSSEPNLTLLEEKAQQKPTSRIRLSNSNTSLLSLQEFADEDTESHAHQNLAEDEEVGLDIDEGEDSSLLRRQIQDLEQRNVLLCRENEIKTCRLFALEEELALLKKNQQNEEPT